MDREIKLIETKPNYSDGFETIDRLVVTIKRSGITEILKRINQFNTAQKEWNALSKIVADFDGTIVAYDDEKEMYDYNSESIEIGCIGVRFRVRNDDTDSSASTDWVSKEQIETILSKLDADETLVEISINEERAETIMGSFQLPKIMRL